MNWFAEFLVVVFSTLLVCSTYAEGCIFLSKKAGFLNVPKRMLQWIAKDPRKHIWQVFGVGAFS